MQHQKLQKQLQIAEQLLTQNKIEEANKILFPMLQSNVLNTHIIHKICILLIQSNDYHASVEKYFQYYFSAQTNGSLKQTQPNQSDQDQILKHGEIYILYAKYLDHVGRSQEALHYYQMAIDLFPSNPVFHYYFSVFLLHSQIKDQNQALFHLQQAINILQHQSKQEALTEEYQSLTYHVYIQYGRLLSNQVQYEKSIHCFYKLIQKFEHSAILEPDQIQQLIECYYECAVVYNLVSDYQKAKEYLKKAINIQQVHNIAVNPYHYITYAQTLIKLDQITLALQSYQKCLGIIPDDTETMRNYSALLAKVHKYTMAINIMQQCIKLEPDNMANYYNYAIILMKADKIQKCLEILRRGLNQKALNSNVQLLALLGFVHYQYCEDYQEAHQAYKLCLQQNPNDFNAQYNYANSLSSLQKYQQALHIYRSLLNRLQTTKNTSNEALHNYKKVLNSYNVLLIKLQRYLEAQKGFKKSLELDPRSHETLYNYALLFRTQKRFQESIQCLERACQLDLGNPLYHLMTGIVYFDCQSYTEARNHLNEANKLLHQEDSNSFQSHNLNSSVKSGLKKYQIKYIKQDLQYYMEMLNTYDEIKQQKLKRTSIQKSQSFLSTSTNDEEIVSISKGFINLLSTTTDPTSSINTTNSLTQEPLKKERWEQEMQQIKKLMIQQISNLRQQNYTLRRQLTSKIIQIENDIYQLKQELLWHAGFDKQLQILELQRKMRAHSYGRKICWMLCSSIQAFRSLKLGIVGAGSGVIQSKVGGFIQKVSSVCDFFSDFPTVGNVCGIISKVTALYVAEEQNIVIDKVIQVTNRYYQQRLLSRASTEAAEYLILDIDHIQILENPKSDDEILSNFESLVVKNKQQVFSRLLDIELKQDEKEALLDCAMIVSYLVKNPDTYAPSQNVLKTAAKAILGEKLNKLKEKPANKTKKAPISGAGCCSSGNCTVM